MTAHRGSLALVLHSHMPYVEGFGTWPFGEEWLWEATASVYLPLLELLEAASAPITLGVTPVLADQLETLPGPAGERLLGFLNGTRAAVHAEDSEGLERTGHPELAAEVRRAGREYQRAAETLAQPGGRDLVTALHRLERDNPIELWTSSATHALLPLIASDAGMRLQLTTGIRSHERRFGGWTGGFWMPECAYVPGLERELADAGVRVTCVDQTNAHGFGGPGNLEPVLTPSGVVAVPIDWQTIQLVWNGLTGYPATGSYRDYHHRTTHDLRPWNIARKPYRPEDAAAQASEHARDFVAQAIRRLDDYSRERGRPGLLCFALDTELLGHWWYEGQTWLAAVLEEAPAQGLDLKTVSDGVAATEPVQRELVASSWGTSKDFSTWDSPEVAELAFAARAAELRTVSAPGRGPAEPAALARAARELLAIQSSDWAFQVKGALSADYPMGRLAGHTAGLDEALQALRDSSAVREPSVRNLAPDLDLAPLLAP